MRKKKEKSEKKLRKSNEYIIKTILDTLEKTNPISMSELAREAGVYYSTVEKWLGFFVLIQKFPKIGIKRIPHTTKPFLFVELAKKESI